MTSLNDENISHKLGFPVRVFSNFYHAFPVRIYFDSCASHGNSQSGTENFAENELDLSIDFRCDNSFKRFLAFTVVFIKSL